MDIETSIKEYLIYVEEILMKKYNLTQNFAKKLISESYLPASITEFPEECLHEDIETVAGIIYHDYLEGV